MRDLSVRLNLKKKAEGCRRLQKTLSINAVDFDTQSIKFQFFLICPDYQRFQMKSS